VQTSAGALVFALAVLVGTAFGIIFLMGGSLSDPMALPMEQPAAGAKPPPVNQAVPQPGVEPAARVPAPTSTPLLAAAPTQPAPVQAAVPPTKPAIPSATIAAPPTMTRAPATAVPKPAATAAQGPAPVGQRVVSGGVGLTVNTVTKRAELGEFMRADPGKTYLVADVTIENVGRDTSPYNPLYFKVKDAEGYEVGSGLSMDDRALRSGEMAAGEQARGTVAFLVPEGARGFVLSYQPLVLFGGYQIIRVDLGQ
jgi:hypothetical protein